MKQYVIERDIPGVGSLSKTELGEAAATSNRALAQIDGIQWLHSYVTADKTFCLYLAETEEAIQEHARISGFPANKITEVREIISPTTERLCAAALTNAA